MFKGKQSSPRGTMIYCCVPFCRSSKNKKQPGVFFHEFPADSVTRQKWLKAVARENVCPKGASATSVVCCLHFTADDYVDGPVTCRKLKPGAVPTVFPGRQPCESLPEQRVTSGRLVSGIVWLMGIGYCNCNLSNSLLPKLVSTQHSKYLSSQVTFQWQHHPLLGLFLFN